MRVLISMMTKTANLILPILAAFLIVGCSSYSVTEGDMTKYLQDNVSFEHSVGVENVIYAHVAVDDLEVKIGRADADRVSVFANTSAKVKMLSQQNMTYDLDIEFSAIPEYDKETGEIFLKSLRLEKIEDNDKLLTPEITKLIKPAISMIGYALSKQPVYKLSSGAVQQVLIKSSNPDLVIEDNKLVIQLFSK